MADKEVVYIVEEGDYSDRHIEGVFTTQDLADEFIANRQPISGPYWEPFVTEWKLNPKKLTVERDGEHLYEITLWNTLHMGADRTFIRRIAWERYDGEVSVNNKGFCVLHVSARDEQHAAKIATEKRAAWVLQGSVWPNREDDDG